MSRADAAIVLAPGPGCGPALPGCVPRGDAEPVTLTWFDTPDGALAAADTALLAGPEGWRLERLRPESPALPCAILCAAERRDMLGTAVPASATPVAAWHGFRQRHGWTGAEGEVTVTLWQGAVGAAALGRLHAEGPPAAIGTFATTLAAGGAVRVPAASFAVEAMAHAGVRPLPLAGPAAPVLGPGQDAGDAAAAVLGNLVETMLHWSAAVATPGDPQPVHQMRVATRRLRTVLSTLRHVFPMLGGLVGPSRDIATRLGAARDWDVFMAGAGQALLGSFPDDARCRALVRAASRARGESYGRLNGFLAEPEFHSTAVALAVTAAVQPWRENCPIASLPVESLAAATLDRRHRAARRAGRGVEHLPAPALHELRKACKRLRYWLDAVAPLYPARPVRRLLRRLSAVQEELGALNDAAAVPALLDQLGRHRRGYAAGLLVGMAEARAEAARHRVEAAWTRVRAVDSFWQV